MINLVCRDADAGITDGQRQPVDAVLHNAISMQGNSTVMGKLGRIRQQVEQRLPQLGQVLVSHAQVLAAFNRKGVVIFLHQGVSGGAHLINQSIQVNVLGERFHLA